PRNRKPSQSKAREEPSRSRPAKQEDPPKKAPDGAKKEGTGPGALRKPRSASPLTELSIRRIGAAASGDALPDNRNLKTLLRVLNSLHDARGDPISFAEQGDSSLTLGAMLKKLEDRFSRPRDKPPFSLHFELDNRAFEAEGVNKPPDE